MAANRVQIELDEWLAFATLKASPVPALAPDEADDLAVSEMRAHRASRDSAA
jgi:hypothetical protein